MDTPLKLKETFIYKHKKKCTKISIPRKCKRKLNLYTRISVLSHKKTFIDNQFNILKFL